MCTVCLYFSAFFCLSRYAVRESSSKIVLFKNFKEKKSFRPEFGAEHIFGGHLLGVKESNSLAFFDWESLELIRRIEISVKNVSCVSVTCEACDPPPTHRCTGQKVVNYVA